MKALTIHEPWSTLIMLGVKRIENRSWSTPYRGRLVIHSARTVRKDIAATYNVEDAISPGYALGTVVLTGIYTQDDVLDHVDKPQFDEFGSGPFYWLLEYADPFSEPIPISGQQGLWNWPL